MTNEPIRSKLHRRRRALVAVGAAAALLAAGGVVGAAFVKSPAQLAADAAAPPPTVLTARVTERVLTSSVAMRGTVYPSTQYAVSTAGGPSPEYVSKLPVTVGSRVTSGKLLAEVDGEPIVVLAGPVPAWRDLAPGERGPDVAELQRALIALGYADGDTRGYFGGGTARAVDHLYEHLGYSAPTGSRVPAGDVLFLPALPAIVTAIDGTVGQRPGSPFLTLATPSALTLTGQLPPAYAAQIRTGLRVTATDEATGQTATGTVTKIGAPTATGPAGVTVTIGGTGGTGSTSGQGASGSGGNAASSVFVPVTVAPTASWPAAFNGLNVLVTVQTGQTAGPVLTVPVAAIVTTASGQSTVTVVGPDGGRTAVPVTPGLSADGYVQVTAMTAGALSTGDTVVTGG